MSEEPRHMEGYVPNYVYHVMPVNTSGLVESPRYVYQAGGVIRVENPNPNAGFLNRGGSGGSGGLGASASPRSNVSDQSNDEGGDVNDQSPVKKVKLLCSYGGKILPRPSDGVFRYVGGQTRIISVRRDISFQELVHKMIDVYGKPVVIRYQLPDGDLDALVSVSCNEDLENMMDEYGKLVESCGNGSAKIRVFLFCASDLDSSGLLQFGDLLDSGQRYIDAVNGIFEGSGGIARKVSLGSETSTHNSDGQIGGSDYIDSAVYGQGDLSSPSVSSSPRVGAVASHDNPTSVGYTPIPMMYAPRMPVSPAENLNGFPPSLQAETEYKRPGPTVVQSQAPLGYDLQRPYGVDFQPATTYMQAYVDPRQQIPMQGGHLNPHGVGMTGSSHRYAETLPLLRDNASVSNQQFLPSVQMHPASFNHHVGINANVQHVNAPAQTRGDYLGENTLNARVVQAQPYPPTSVYQPQSPSYLPSSIHQPQPPSYLPSSVYQPQLPNHPPSSVYQSQSPTYPPSIPQSPMYRPAVPQSPNYSPSSVYQPHHAVLSDGRVTHQPGVLPEKLPKVADCFMCQKQLPHAHSDTVVQDQRHCIDSSVSDTSLIFRGAQLEHNFGSQPISSVAVSEASDEPEYMGPRTQMRAINQIDHMTSELGRLGFMKDLEVQPEEKTLQKLAAPDNAGVSFLQGETGKLVGGTSPHPVMLHSILHPLQENVFHKSSVADQIRQEPIVSLPPVQTSAVLNHESSTEHSSNNSSLVVEEDALAPGIQYERFRPVGGRVGGNYINQQEIPSSSESLVNKHSKEDYLVSRLQIPGQEYFPSGKFTQGGVPPDRSHLTAAGTLPSIPSGATHLDGLHNVESTQLTQPVMLGTTGPYSYYMTETPQNVGTHQMIPQEQLHGNPVLLVPHSDYPLCSTQPVEPRTDASGFQRRFSNEAHVSPLVPSSSGASSTYGETFQDNWKHSPQNSLFSNQDPWALLHDQHSLPLNTNNEAANEEAFITRKEEFVQKPTGHLNKDANYEHLRSNKDVADDYIKQELKAAAEEVLNNPLKQLKPDSDFVRTLSNREEVSDELELKSVAEGVAAMVLQTPIPNDSPVQVNKSSPGVGHNRVLDSSTEVQNTAKLEDEETKLPDKENIGRPLSGGIGCLQIIKNSDLEELSELGSGTFGTVYHGKWRGTDVAIKRINDRCFAGKPSERSRMIDDFWNEAIKLADLHHPNVVAFYGVVLDGPGDSVATVTEYMVNGSLRQALQRTINRRKRLLISMDAAFGMEYLHGKNIVHFDLKSDNLLVNLKDPQRPICKVGDLGLSKVKAHTLISGGVRGTLPWMAPELLNGSSSLVSEKVDVFSFGIVMWELLTGEEPYADLHYGIIIGGIVSNTLRPTVPESCDPEWRSLMERCWSADPSERPNFTEIANQLRSMAASLPAKAQAH